MEQDKNDNLERIMSGDYSGMKAFDPSFLSAGHGDPYAALIEIAAMPQILQLNI